MKSLKKIFLNGIVDENPIFRLMLGLCPTLAVTTAAINGVGMGLAATFVLVGSNLVVSLLKKLIPEKIRIPAFIVIIATFVTVVQLVMEATLPSLFNALGIFIPLIVVNCIILSRAEIFASKNTPLAAVIDGLGMGLGFTLAITLLAAFRELLGNGTLFGLTVMGSTYEPALIFIMAPGGFILLGFILAFLNAMRKEGA
ncbi:MAG: electron transport complex subunit E [Clostridiales bacterium]|nr:electron transport complex subunit E [Clostridiales bacterium]